MNIDLSERVAWICGASGTLGIAIATAFAKCGASPVLSSRAGGRLSAAGAAVSRISGVEPVIEPFDITDDSSVRSAAERIVGRFSRIDILVNCSTLPIFGDFETISDDDWLLLTQTKLLGYVRTMRAAIPHMVARKDGRIVNLSGGSGRQPFENHAPGSAMNAATTAVTKALANRYGKHGIRINALAPGPIESERWATMSSSAAAPSAATIPMGRLGRAEEIASATVFLASDLASFVNGTLLAVDGGRVGFI
jgi:NAD(P)-dependent dehydrogenase (short-subunit alcohol dehydrogenase family)